MKPASKEQSTQNQTGSRNNLNAKAESVPGNPDQTKGRDGEINEHKIKADTKATVKQDSKK